MLLRRMYTFVRILRNYSTHFVFIIAGKSCIDDFQQ